MRAKQRNKTKSKEVKIDDLKKWHFNYREQCIKVGSGCSFDEKNGVTFNLNNV